MKTINTFLIFYLILHLANVNAQVFFESECGIIPNPSYSYSNSQSSSFGLGYKLYHNDVLISQMESTGGAGHGYQVVLLKFINDTTGYFIYSSKFHSITKTYVVNKIEGNTIKYLCSGHNVLYFYIVNANLAYMSTAAMDWVLVKCSDIQPTKQLTNNPPKSDTTIIDTIIGAPLCQNLSELNIRYDTINFKIVFHIIDTTTSINENNTSQLEIFPNPADNYVYFKTNNTLNSSKIKIFDCKGVLKKSIILNKDFKQTIYVGDLRTGVYFIEIYQGRKKYSAKMIKN